MKPDLPTREDIAELLAFLPTFATEGFEPVRHVAGGVSADGKDFVLQKVRYNGDVEKFMRLASKECWSDGDYDAEDAGRRLAVPDAVMNADIAQVRAMLAYCVRGERFCDGFWSELMKRGRLQMLLRRLGDVARE